MPKLLKKLYSLSIWNSSAAALNFASNIIIAKVLGTAIFGDLFYLASMVGIFSLLLIIIPPNYSLIRYQDDERYKYILAAFYLIVWVLLLIPVVVFRSWVELPVWLFYLFTFSFSLQSYFDIRFQASNKLNRYYAMLFLQAITKIILILLAYLMGYLQSFIDLVLIITISQLAISIIYLFNGKPIFLKSPAHFKKVFELIIEERKLFSSYYFNIGLKKISGNLIVLLFEPLVTRDILGVYALLMKVLQFIQGLIRTIESIFLFKKNLEHFSGGFLKNGLIIGFVLQLIHIVVGIFYMKYIEGNYYFPYLLVMSFISYFYVFFIKARAYFISRYQNQPINWSYSLFLLPILFLFLIKKTGSTITNLQELVGLYMVASILQMGFLIFYERKIKFNTKISHTN